MLHHGVLRIQWHGQYLTAQALQVRRQVVQLRQPALGAREAEEDEEHALPPPLVFEGLPVPRARLIAKIWGHEPGLRLETRLNGETVQSATTDQLIFDVPALIEFISSWTTLEPGDLILTGTPAGVGAGRKPPVWLKPGDIVEVEIEGMGVLRNPVVRDERPVATNRWSHIAGNEE